MINTRFCTLSKAKPILSCLQDPMVHLEIHTDQKIQCRKVCSEAVCREGSTVWACLTFILYHAFS